MRAKPLIILASVVCIAAGAYYIFKDDSSDIDSINLARVLDVTVDTMVKIVKKGPSSIPEKFKDWGDDGPTLWLADELAIAYNATKPPLDVEQISVQAHMDASLLAFIDKNNNDAFDYDNAYDLSKPVDIFERALFLIEVDGHNKRIIATSENGAVSERVFRTEDQYNRVGGHGFFTGYLIGNMLSRQQTVPGAANSVAKTKTVTSTQARARARAGSGSHSRGK
jgi:hypothetical protein